MDPIWGREHNSPQLNTVGKRIYYLVSSQISRLLKTDFHIIPQLNVKIPDLKLLNHLPKLSTPSAMASLGKHSKFAFDGNNNNQENIN